MPIRNVTQRNSLAAAYGTAAPYGALFSGDPGIVDLATNEVIGVTYARKAIAWSGPAASAITGAPVFDIDAGITVAYAGVCAGAIKTTADVHDSAAMTPQAFVSPGTYTVTFAYTQS